MKLRICLEFIKALYSNKAKFYIEHPVVLSPPRPRTLVLLFVCWWCSDTYFLPSVFVWCMTLALWNLVYLLLIVQYLTLNMYTWNVFIYLPYLAVYNLCSFVVLFLFFFLFKKFCLSSQVLFLLTAIASCFMLVHQSEIGVLLKLKENVHISNDRNWSSLAPVTARQLPLKFRWKINYVLGVLAAEIFYHTPVNFKMNYYKIWLDLLCVPIKL